eukprot:TRINITY_DN13555_c0_g1_i1.p1 TRINITY_DN13555_c0_g1~~TRINITY_DN13555_c0_g1_i1.p1  ORF type:complete len:1104 (+),score=373.10 TRINITY_DN13555_c0_g1_i1:111-3422(+)
MMGYENILTENDLLYIQQIIKDYNDELVWRGWVSMRSKKGKETKRIIVIGKYRIYIITIRLEEKKIKNQGHLYGIKKIIVENSKKEDNSEEIKIIWKNFEISFYSNAVKIINIIKSNLSVYSYNLPKDFLNIESDLELIGVNEIECKGNFEAMYIACCNYYRCHPNEGFITYVNDLISEDNTELELSQAPGIEDSSSSDSLSLFPIARTLQYDSHFKSIILQKISQREDSIEIFSKTIMKNTTIKTFFFSELKASQRGFVKFSEALQENENTGLRVLVFSGNNMEEEGAIALAKCLSTLKNGLKTIDFSKCNITPKGMSALIYSLSNNSSFNTSLVELTLSKNNVGTKGGEELSRWFSGSQKISLKRLFLSNTKLNLELILRQISIKGGLIEKLTHLDISQNILTPPAASDLAHFLGTIKTLKFINISQTNCGKQIEMILSSLVYNKNLNSLHFNTSKNNLGQEGAKNMTRHLGKCICLKSIDISGNQFGEYGLIQVLTTLLLLPNLMSVSVGNNVKTKEVDKLPSFLSDFVERSPNLRSISLKEKEGMGMGTKIKPFLKIIAANPKLVQLDISGNHIKDTSFQVLCDSLRVNKTLKSLYWDSNDITPTGWQLFKSCLQFNTTLDYISYPIKDINKVLSNSKKNETSLKEKIDKLMQSISEIIKKNTQLNKKTNSNSNKKYSDDEFFPNEIKPISKARQTSFETISKISSIIFDETNEKAILENFSNIDKETQILNLINKPFKKKERKFLSHNMEEHLGNFGEKRLSRSFGNIALPIQEEKLFPCPTYSPPEFWEDNKLPTSFEDYFHAPPPFPPPPSNNTISTSFEIENYSLSSENIVNNDLENNDNDSNGNLNVKNNNDDNDNDNDGDNDDDSDHKNNDNKIYEDTDNNDQKKKDFNDNNSGFDHLLNKNNLGVGDDEKPISHKIFEDGNIDDLKILKKEKVVLEKKIAKEIFDNNRKTFVENKNKTKGRNSENKIDCENENEDDHNFNYSDNHNDTDNGDDFDKKEDFSDPKTKLQRQDQHYLDLHHDLVDETLYDSNKNPTVPFNKIINNKNGNDNSHPPNRIQKRTSKNIDINNNGQINSNYLTYHEEDDGDDNHHGN